MSGINYKHTLQVEVLTEFAANVTNRFSNYLIQTGISLSDEKNPLVTLLNQLEDMSSENLFDQTEMELGKLLYYWQKMNEYVIRVSGDNETTKAALEKIELIESGDLDAKSYRSSEDLFEDLGI